MTNPQKYKLRVNCYIVAKKEMAADWPPLSLLSVVNYLTTFFLASTTPLL